MTKMTFEDPFLTEVYKAVLKRRKALRHRGKFLLYDISHDDEMFGISLVMSNRIACIVEFGEGGVMHLFIRSQVKYNRGKYLVCIQDQRVPSNGALLVSTFEDWCSATWEEGFWPDGTRSTQETWDAVTIDLVQSYDE